MVYDISKSWKPKLMGLIHFLCVQFGLEGKDFFSAMFPHEISVQLSSDVHCIDLNCRCVCKVYSHILMKLGTCYQYLPQSWDIV